MHDAHNFHSRQINVDAALLFSPWIANEVKPLHRAFFFTPFQSTMKNFTCSVKTNWPLVHP